MSRRVLDITGADRLSFLQGLVSNDMRRVDEATLVYAALLTPQGKYLADFFVGARGEAIFIDVDATLADALMKRLSMYRLRAQVEIAPSALQVATGESGLADPRHPALPHRTYGDRADAPDPVALRVAHCIPRTGIELTGDSYILEAGFERLNGVDFKKGCYVGQEVTARMKHKATLRKGLVRVDIDGAAPIGTPVTRDGAPVGTVYSQSGGRALAHLRYDRADGDLCAGDATIRWDGQRYEQL